MSPVVTVLQVINNWVPGMGRPGDIHGELNASPEFRSIRFAERLLDGGSAYRDDDLTYLVRVKQGSILSRVDRFFTERTFRRVYGKYLTWHLKQKVKRLGADILHAHFGMTGTRLVDLKHQTGLPLIVTFYGVDASYCLRTPRWRKPYTKMFSTADLFIVLCEEVRERLVRAGCPGEKIRIWNCAADLTIYPCRPSVEVLPPRFITAARFVPKKGYPLLLSAFALVKREYPEATLTVLGYGPDEVKVKKMISGLGLSGSVEVINTEGEPDFRAFYADQLYRNSIFVLTSTTSKEGDDEGGPALTLIAAQATGMPVVCTPFVGAERSVFDGETGFLCRDGDSQSVAERMIYAIEHPELCECVGRAASEYVNTNFSEREQTFRMMAFYREVLK